MPPTVFTDRADAGRRLGATLSARGAPLPADLLVIGVAGDGAMTATEVAEALGAPVTTVVVAPIRVAGPRGARVGAVGPNGVALVDRSLVERFHLDEEWLDASIAGVRRAVLRRQAELSPGLPAVRDRAVLVVDDYLASGARAAVVGRWLRHAESAWRGLAVPIAAGPALERVGADFDEVVSLVTAADAAAAARTFAPTA